MGIRSTNGVNDHLKALEQKGYLERAELSSRAMRPIRSERLTDTLRKLDWDGHGWESVRTAVRVAAAYLEDRMPDAVDYGCGPATQAVEALRGREFGYPRSQGDDG